MITDRKPHVLFLDLQDGLIGIASTLSVAKLRAGIKKLARVATLTRMQCHASVIPVGPGLVPPLIAELAESGNLAQVVTRQTFSAFAPVFGEGLKHDRLDGLVLAGVATEGAVLATALSATALGWPVWIAVDACSGLTVRTEEAAFRQIEASGGVLTSITSVASTLGGSLDDIKGRELLRVLASVD